MKIECVREKIQIAISNAERAVGKNTNLPILACLQLATDQNNLIIKSTNLDIGLEIKVPVKVHTEGELVIPARILASFISNIDTDRNIFLEEIDNNLHIYNDKNKATIKSFPKEDFPTIPHLTDGKNFKINPQNLLAGLKSVWYVSSISSVKPELSSVYVYADGGELVFVATDSFRLAEKRIKVAGLDESIALLIPYKNIPEIIKIIEQAKEDIVISYDKNQITFEFDGVYMVSRLINGSFPDYKQIIPNNFVSEVTILKQDFINCLKISSIFSDKFNQINLNVSIKKKTLTISTKNSDVGENSSDITGAFNGEDYSANFNQKYISDSFQSLFPDSVTIYFNGNQKPIIIRGHGDVSFLYLVMPMNR